MACRAVHFAITNEDLKALRDAGSDAKLVEIIQEVIEERWEKAEDKSDRLLGMLEASYEGFQLQKSMNDRF